MRCIIDEEDANDLQAIRDEDEQVNNQYSEYMKDDEE